MSQNSGVSLAASTPSFSSSRDENPITGNVTYYGSIEEIIELFYLGHSSVILFGCVWYHVEKDKHGLVRVDRNKQICANEPFILASQAHQVFYVEDQKSKGCCYVVQNLRRDKFDASANQDNEYGEEILAALVHQVIGMLLLILFSISCCYFDNSSVIFPVAAIIRINNSSNWKLI